MNRFHDTDEDLAAQDAIRSGGNRSIAILEKAFIRNGSGRYMVLRAPRELVADEMEDAG